MDLTKTPAMQPPPGEFPDFDAPDPLLAVHVFLIIFCLSLCTILLTIQLSTKHFLLHGVQWEDCKPYSSIPHLPAMVSNLA